MKKTILITEIKLVSELVSELRYYKGAGLKNGKVR